MHAILQPSSGPAARAHFEETIAAPVSLESINEYLTPNEKVAILDAHDDIPLYFWGVTPGERGQHLTKWNRIAPGDTVFFSKDGGLFAWANVTTVLRNYDLAKHLRGTTLTKNGMELTWELMFSMTKVSYFNLPYGELNRIIGRKPNAVVQEFQVLKEEESQQLLDALGLDENRFASAPSADDIVQILEDPHFQDLERQVIAKQRTEQRFLRKKLFGNASHSICELCGRTFPTNFLVAAHIKRRSLCTDLEKRDFDHIVMSNCKFGCDELYGRGLVGVDREGAIILSANLEPGSIPHEYAMTQLNARVVSRSLVSTNSRDYFAAHFEAEFRRAEE